MTATLYAIECMDGPGSSYYIKDMDNSLRVWSERAYAEDAAHGLALNAGGTAAYRVVTLRVDNTSDVQSFYIFGKV